MKHCREHEAILRGSFVAAVTSWRRILGAARRIWKAVDVAAHFAEEAHPLTRDAGRSTHERAYGWLPAELVVDVRRRIERSPGTAHRTNDWT